MTRRLDRLLSFNGYVWFTEYFNLTRTTDENFGFSHDKSKEEIPKSDGRLNIIWYVHRDFISDQILLSEIKLPWRGSTFDIITK